MFQRLFDTVFQRREQLPDLKRKTIEPMVLTLIGPEPNAVRAGQHFISQGPWETQVLIWQYQAVTAEWLPDPYGVEIRDGSGFPRQDQDSAGVAHEYRGAWGKVINCQGRVFAVYVRPSSCAFLDAYL